tara:strand:+ start:57 stop:530 length:474 start_codon:yes stop_codon:yes gene_type:complete
MNQVSLRETKNSFTYVAGREHGAMIRRQASALSIGACHCKWGHGSSQATESNGLGNGIIGMNFNADDMQWNTGDFNLDNMTDVADLDIIGANWSASQTTGNASALVPEPTTLSLLAVSVLMLGADGVNGCYSIKTLQLSSIRWYTIPHLKRVFFAFV